MIHYPIDRGIIAAAIQELEPDLIEVFGVPTQKYSRCGKLVSAFDLSTHVSLVDCEECKVLSRMEVYGWMTLANLLDKPEWIAPLEQELDRLIVQEEDDS